MGVTAVSNSPGEWRHKLEQAQTRLVGARQRCEEAERRHERLSERIETDSVQLSQVQGDKATNEQLSNAPIPIMLGGLGMIAAAPFALAAAPVLAGVAVVAGIGGLFGGLKLLQRTQDQTITLQHAEQKLERQGLQQRVLRQEAERKLTAARREVAQLEATVQQIEEWLTSHRQDAVEKLRRGLEPVANDSIQSDTDKVHVGPVSVPLRRTP